MKFIILASMFCYVQSLTRLQEVFSWSMMDWKYPDEFSRKQSILSGSLIQQNALPVGIEVWRNKLFVTVPRWRPGIPATLNTISLDDPYDPSPKLTPYPSWEANELGNCENGLTTTYRLKADKCNRLWVLDTGTYGIGNTTTNPCPYAINVYDLNTDRRIRKYVLRPQDINVNTFIANIAVDIGKSCEDTFAYFPDELGYGLVVYSWHLNKSWRFEHSFFMPDPLRGDFNVAGLNFQWGAEGIFGISLSPIKKDGFRTLYFSPIASHRAFSVSTRVLRDESRVADSYHDFQVLDERGPDGHLASTIMSDDGVQLMTLIDQNAIGCWNERLPYKPQNHAVLDRNDVTLVYPSDVNIDSSGFVWVISDRMPVFLESELDYRDVNFRIFTAPLNDLISDTVCEKRDPKIKPGLPAPSSYYQTQISGIVTRKPKVKPVQQALVTSIGPQTFTTTQVPPRRNNVPTVESYLSSHRPVKPTKGFISSQELKTNELGTSFISSQTPIVAALGPSTTSWWGNYQVYERANSNP